MASFNMDLITKIYLKEFTARLGGHTYFKKASAHAKIRAQPFFGKWVASKSDTITIRRPVKFEATNG